MPRIEPRILKGFRDYLPEVMIPRTRLLRRIADVFERFGFDPLDTPALEYSDILLGKAGPEAEKLFYRFKDHGQRDIALRYELTISLARVVAQYRNDLPRPFKRYQMGPVWRAESPARGRFREFWQCDVDIIGTDSLLADAECLAVDHAVMRSLSVPRYVIRFNNRKLFRGLQARIGVSDDGVMDAVMRGIDKFDKIGEKGVRAELEPLIKQGGFSKGGLDLVFEFLALGKSDLDNAARIDKLEEFLDGDIGAQGCGELRQVFATALELGVSDEVLRVDPTIVRGLDYYTGTVFETFLEDLPGFGSIMSGGRYDGLIGMFAGEEIPAVGISVGVDRLIAALEELKLLPKARTTAAVLVTIFAPETQAFSLRAARELRRAGLPTELYLDAKAKLGKQLKYAGKRGFPLVVIAGPEEEKEGVVSLRNMATGEQMRVSIEQLPQVAQDNYVDPEGGATGRTWDWPYREEMIDRVPNVGGVYLLRNEQHEVLKCGWASFGMLAEAIRESVGAEQRPQVASFDWYEIRDDKLSEMLAAFMIEKLSPKFNK